MTACAVLYVGALCGMVVGLSGRDHRYHGRVAGVNVLLLAVSGLVLAIGRL